VPKAGDIFIGNASDRPVIDASGTYVGFDDHNASGITFENMVIEGAQLNGLKTQCSYCGRGIWGGNALRVFNVSFMGNQQAGIAGSEGTTTSWLIVGSQFIGNGSQSEVGFSSGGIKGSNAYTILNSYVADNIGSGIWCDVGCRGGIWTVEGNTVVGNTAGGIRYEISDAGALISGNVVEGNNVSGKNGLAGIEIASSGNAVVEDNLVVDNENAAILVGGNGRHASQVINDMIRDNDTQTRGVHGCGKPGVTCENNT
jgi:parallel beta-helix repeat protein